LWREVAEIKVERDGGELAVKKIVWCLWLVLAMPSMALALGRMDGAYYCTEKFSGGLKYDNTLKEWHGTIFKVGDNFVVKLSQTKPPPEEQDPNAQDRYYSVTITVEGHSSNVCLANYKPPFVGDDRVLRCEVSAGLHIYAFNFDNHRFIEIYTAGYVDGSNNDSPNVTGGLCTKISQ
jgi:hypothetical protein